MDIALQSQVSMHGFPLPGKLVLQKGLLAANGNLAFSHYPQVARLQEDPSGYLVASLSNRYLVFRRAHGASDNHWIHQCLIGNPSLEGPLGTDNPIQG